MKLKIQQTISLPRIPSASGISTFNNHLFLIGDNAPFLYEVDEDLYLVSKTQIYSDEHLQGDIIAKKLKPDFEAFELINEKELIIFGSGSKSPERDCFIRVFLGEKVAVKPYNITPFYNHLKSLDIMLGSELNIEALAAHNGKLFLFNRRRNIIFSFDYKAFIEHLDKGAAIPTILATKVNLPKINGIEAGLSGATTTNTHQLIFTASVENTSNAYDDGAVLGSFVGMVDIEKIEDQAAYQYVLIENEGAPLKVESVAVQNENADNQADLLLVTDSDGGESLLLKVQLEW